MHSDRFNKTESLERGNTPLKRGIPKLLILSSFLCSVVFLSVSHLSFLLPSLDNLNGTSLDALCPQDDSISPVKHAQFLENIDELYHTEEFKLNAYESLGGVIRIPSVFLPLLTTGSVFFSYFCRTESEDEEKSPSEDPVFWEKFRKLHEYLEERFPLT